MLTTSSPPKHAPAVATAAAATKGTDTPETLARARTTRRKWGVEELKRDTSKECRIIAWFGARPHASCTEPWRYGRQVLRSTLTVALLSLTMARSGLPSPFRSAAAIASEAAFTG